MTTFGLVHGAFHGSWCWTMLRSELERRGHRVLTVDLPCENRDAGAVEYVEAAVGAFVDAPDDLVLVGHSLAGLTIPLVAVRRPVYLCAMLPRPGRSHDDVLREEPDMFFPWPSGGGHQDADGATLWAPEATARFFPTVHPTSPGGRQSSCAASTGRSPSRPRRCTPGPSCQSPR
ncbi:MAG TPA: alpha/beta fold hydrolase [Nakamurella sp.]|jgi:hypothetical protein